MMPIHERIMDALTNLSAKRRRQLEVTDGHAPAVWLATLLHNGHIAPASLSDSGRAILVALAGELGLEGAQCR